jgi:hypothetical protein
MSSTSLSKKPASVMRQYTQPVRDHSAAMARITDHYFATLKRAEAQYFDSIKRITEAVTTDTTEASVASEAPQQASAS